MLSSIHPLGEAGRGQRWWLTVTAHVIGAGAGGAVVAAVLGALGRLAAAGGAGPALRLGFVAVAAAGAAVVDWRGWPGWLWRPHRQVDEDWMTRYRGWVYGGGFGVQLGMGVTTIVTAATVYVVGAVAFAVASVPGAAVLGAAFGLARGATVLAGRSIDRPERLVAFHRRLQERARWGRAAAVTADTVVLAAVMATLVRGA